MFAKEIPSEKNHRTSWWTEENCPRLKKYLVNSWHPDVRGQCDESCLELGLDPVSKQTVFNVLKRIFRKPITYANFFPYEEEDTDIKKSGKVCGGCFC